MTRSARTWVLPEEPVSVRLMGTIWADTDGLHDDLETASGFDAWMEAVGVDQGTASATSNELAEARALRDSLRLLAAIQTEDTRPTAVSHMTDASRAVGVLNTAARRLPIPQLQIQNNAFRRTSTATSAVPAALAGIATEAVNLFGGPDADKLRACQAPGCVLYFVKTHHRREWCSIACGNRARAARHYQRIRQTTPQE